MADQKRWFKMWTSIVGDDDFDPTRPDGLEAVGRFALLGAYTALHGTRGRVTIMPDTLFRLLRVSNLEALRTQLTLKNVSFEEGKNHYGKIIVTWKKWQKYQQDSTVAERMKTLRSKRRREERRGEEIRKEEKESILSPEPEHPMAPVVEEWPAEDLWLKEFLLTQTWLPSPHTALYEHAWWDRVSEIVNGLDETIIRQEFARMAAWCQENPSRRPTGKGIRRFIRGWFERRYERERRQHA